MDRYVGANGLRHHLLDHGGDGPTLLPLPGLSSNCHYFDAIVEDGLSPEVRVLALDLRGRGLTDRPASGFSLADHEADVIGVLDALDLGKAFSCG